MLLKKLHLALLACGLLTAAIVLAGPKDSSVHGPEFENEVVTVDLPDSQQFKNIGSKLDGAGMCVFTSVEMAARWNNMEDFRGFRDWCAAHYPGGGYPEKLAKLITAYCKAKNIPEPPYVQYEGSNPESFLELIDKTGRMACITYGYSPRYGGGTIAHMVCSPKYNGKYGVVLDNNFIGEQQLEWMSKEELIKRIKHPQGSGWVFVWLTASAAPPVHNLPIKPLHE